MSEQPVDIHQEREVRAQKLAKIREAKIQPYPSRFERTHTINMFEAYIKENDLRISEEVFKSATNDIKIAGRMISFREHGKIAFANLKDMTGVLQICFKQDVIGKEKMKFAIKMLDMGDFLGLEGELFLTKQDKLTLLVTDYILLGKTLRPLPSKFHGLENIETAYRQRYLDMIANQETFDRFRLRSNIVQSMREWLLNKDFLEIVTRSLQPKAGGAMAETFMTHHNAFDEDFHLRISPELDLKMAVVGGMERVFEFATNFRNEGIDPSHLQEFQMLEWYAAYENFETGMNWTEEMIRYVLKKTTGELTCTVFDKEGKEQIVDFEKPIPRMRFDDILKKYTDITIHSSFDELLAYAKEIGLDEKVSKTRSYGNLLDDIYKKKARPHLIDPVFVTHYPTVLVPLARQSDVDQNIAESYQLLVGSWEIVKAYSELVDPIRQREMFTEQAAAKAGGDKEAMDVDEEYLAAMEHGMPPMTGWGMGIDRFVTLVTGQKNLRDTVLFPLMRPVKK
jgi:lysyl-tRNA synthetase, class II